MIEKSGDKTWDNASTPNSPSRIAKAVLPRMLVAALALVSALMIQHSSQESTITYGNCPSLYTSGTIAQSGGAFDNGDFHQMFQLACSSGNVLGSLCDIVCRPNYVTGSHLGSLVVCGVSGTTMMWMPSGASALVGMCQPDIIMSTPNLQFHIRADLSSSDSKSLTDYSGYGRSATVNRGFSAPTQLSADAAPSMWEFVGNANQYLTVDKLPGERMYFEAGGVDVAFFIVAQPTTSDQWNNILDIVTLSHIFNGLAATTCQPETQTLHVMSLIIKQAGDQSYITTLRMDGVDCLSSTVLDLTSFHKFDQYTTSTMLIGCGLVTNGICSQPYTGKLAEMVMYTNLGWDLSSVLPPGILGISATVLTNDRLKVEAIEYFLMQKYGLGS